MSAVYAPLGHSAGEVFRVVASGGVLRAGERVARSPAGLTDERHQPAHRQIPRVGMRQGKVHGPEDVSCGEFARLANVDDLSLADPNRLRESLLVQISRIGRAGKRVFNVLALSVQAALAFVFAAANCV